MVPSGRSWTRLGTLGSPERALVDPRGLLTPRRGGWSIDWWIGAEDRWHLPSREAAVRQNLIDGTPVVETSMRVPGGDAVICHYVWESPSGPQVVIEVDNRSASPFAVALAVRPFNVEGPAPVHRLEWSDRSLWVNGGLGLVLATSAQDVVLSDRAGGDALDVLMARTDLVAPGLLAVSSVTAVEDATGGATAAVVVPVAHRTLMRALVPLGAAAVRPGATAGRHRRRTKPPGVESVAAGSLPDAERFSAASLPAPAVIAAGWNQQTERRLRIDWPTGRFADAVTAQRHHLLLTEQASASGWSYPPGDGVSGPSTRRPRWWRRQDHDRLSVIGAHPHVDSHPVRRPGVVDAEVAMALVTSGAIVEAGQRLTGWIQGASSGGDLGVDRTSTAAVLCALELHDSVARTVTADSATVAEAAEAVARASAAGPSSSVSLPWAVAGLTAAARLLGALGEERAAGTARDWVGARLAPLDALADPNERLLAVDLGLLDPAVALDAVRSTLTAGGIPANADRDHHDRGISTPGPTDHPAAELVALRVGLRAGSEEAGGDLDRFLASASSTWTWPDVIDDRTGDGLVGDGHSSAVVAGLWQLARDLLVRDQPGWDATVGVAGSISICTWFPDGWLGDEMEVHGLPTRYGQLSYALRWHGTRPALLWEMADALSGTDLRLHAPGLDPRFAGRGLRGEALLSQKAR